SQATLTGIHFQGFGFPLLTQAYHQLQLTPNPIAETRCGGVIGLTQTFRLPNQVCQTDLPTGHLVEGIGSVVFGQIDGAQML
ncbi:hypothetical protein M1O12_03635, partial [Dehalococcoidia bacterium]|nr:hypothetical protein [Dehalococcoidia bacterium]